MRRISYALLSLLVVGRPVAAQDRAIDSTATSWTYQSQNARFTAEVVATGLQRPVALSFLPDGRLLVADRQIGQLSILDVGTGALTAVTGIPAVHGKIDGGLLDVLVHPQYARNGWLYLAYAVEVPMGTRPSSIARGSWARP
jgi:aldose sugar dehydrogenase